LSLKKQIIFSTLVLISAGVVICSYQIKDIVLFWKIHDLGILMLVSSFIYMTLDLFIINITLWLLATFVLNSAITSWFYDVTIFGSNQKVFGWFVALLFLVVGATYNISNYYFLNRERKKYEVCKREAKDKYKNILERIDNHELAMEDMTGKLNEFFKRLSI